MEVGRHPERHLILCRPRGGGVDIVGLPVALGPAAVARDSLADSQFSTCNRLASRIEKLSCGGCSARTSAALRFLYQNELIPE